MTDVARRRMRRLAFVAVGLLLFGLGAVLGPVRSGAWPWDDNREIHVSGQVVCRNWDVDQPYGIPKVEWLEIRGRSGVLMAGKNSYVRRWETSVPPGWKIEWFLKCSGSSSPDKGTFVVDKSVVGSSYDQQRHICGAAADIFEPCTDQRFGGCVAMLFDGSLEPPKGNFEDALQILAEAYGPGFGPNSAVECAKALAGTVKHEEPPPATSPTSPPTLPPITATPLPSIDTVPTAPGTTPHTNAPPPTDHTQPTSSPTRQRVNSYDNYGSSAVTGRAMCRGNPGDAVSMPGGVVWQTFTVPGGVASIDTVKVQIDPDSRVSVKADLSVNATIRATNTQSARGDTSFDFGTVKVAQGDSVTLTLYFSATYGKIITVYTVGTPGGHFTASNSCPDGAPNVDTSSTGLRAVFSGWSR